MVSPMFPSMNFTLVDLDFASFIHLVSFCIWHNGPTLFFSMWISSYSNTICKMCPSSNNWSWNPCRISLDHIHKSLFLCFLLYCFSLFVCLYTSTTLFDYCSLVICSEIRMCEFPNFVLFQNCFSNSGFLEILNEF